MKIAYFDCSSGISGDMCLGALVDAGMPLRELQYRLRALPLKGYRLRASRVTRSSLVATKIDVIIKQSGVDGQQSARKWKDVEKIIKTSSLPSPIKQKGLSLFKRLFSAEGRIHGSPYQKTHLHELGAVDCLVDVFGTLIALDFLGIEKVCSSAVNLGSGSVMTSHGRLPVPAPATAELLKGCPVYSSGSPFELATPTGAAIVREVAACCGDMPLMKTERVGYGAGQRDIDGHPNVLRIFLGEEMPQQKPPLPKVAVIETNIDDMNPQLYEYVMERLFAAGALDVFLTQVIMKKGRPGILITILCSDEKKADIMDTLLKETTTIGLRFYEASRLVLDRKLELRKTEFGKVTVKASQMPDGTVRVWPEYEDCRKIAREYGIPLIEVMRRLNTAGKKSRKRPA